MSTAMQGMLARVKIALSDAPICGAGDSSGLMGRR
jgi:hypothetical protein